MPDSYVTFYLQQSALVRLCSFICSMNVLSHYFVEDLEVYIFPSLTESGGQGCFLGRFTCIARTCPHYRRSFILALELSRP